MMPWQPLITPCRVKLSKLNTDVLLVDVNFYMSKRPLLSPIKIGLYECCSHICNIETLVNSVIMFNTLISASVMREDLPCFNDSNIPPS